MTAAEHMVLIDEAADRVRAFVGKAPIAAGIILGTGLGGLVRELQVEGTLDYEEIPHFPVSTVESHHGRLIVGTLRGHRVLVMQGRFHYYEGYTLQQVTFPVRVMHRVGIDTLLASNACGCVNPQFRAGELMIMEDHINLLGDNPLIGPNLDELGTRFPDMSAPYDRGLIALAERLALELKLPVQKGVYVAVAGPNLETRAEYRFLRTVGADVVGMSTVPECIVARHMGMRVFGMSVITDECFPEALKAVALEEILATAGRAEPGMTRLLAALVEALPPMDKPERVL
jgi:purine-nucleoside phosphorylase